MTMVMWILSKSQFKAQMLEFLRKVEQEKKPLVLTHEGKPVVTIVPYTDEPDTVLQSLRGSVMEYVDPLEPVGASDWESVS
jgi:prevent-host-death family protein